MWSRLLSHIRIYKVKDICRGQHIDTSWQMWLRGHKWIQLLVIMSVMVMIMMMLIQAINAFYKWLQFLISYLSMPMTLLRRRRMTVTCECIDMNGDNMVNALPPVALGQLLHRLLATFWHVLRRFFQYFKFSTFFSLKPSDMSWKDFLNSHDFNIHFLHFISWHQYDMSYKIIVVTFQMVWSSRFKC